MAFNIFGGGSDPGSGYMDTGNLMLGQAGQDASNMDGLAGYNAGVYRTYDPARIANLRSVGQYWTDLANNGYTDTQKNLILGQGMPGGAFDDITAQQNNATLQQQLNGTDTPETST